MESGTTAMEAITALIVGPMCLLVAFASSHGYSWHHPLQIIVCTCQLYGLTWFTLQPIFSHTGLAGHFSSDPVSCFEFKFVVPCIALFGYVVRRCYFGLWRLAPTLRGPCSPPFFWCHPSESAARAFLSPKPIEMLMILCATLIQEAALAGCRLVCSFYVHQQIYF